MCGASAGPYVIVLLAASLPVMWQAVSRFLGLPA